MKPMADADLRRMQDQINAMKARLAVIEGAGVRDEDYLTTSPTAVPCVWCHVDIPADQPAELVVKRDDKQWWSCSRCAAETRVGAKEGE